MTVSTQSSTITVAATGASSYAFPFIGVASTDVSVLYTNTSGSITTVSPTAYTVSLNAPLTGQIWGVGGTISPAMPTNYLSGSLTFTRTLPLTQQIEIGNQGNQYPIVTEEALDILCMEIQQVAARTGAYRGVWVTGTVYNFGDIVQDGVGGSFTNNIYVCANANISGIWATDLAAGDWILSISVATLQPPGSFLPLSGGTISGNLGVQGTTALAGMTSTSINSSPIGAVTPAAGAFTTLSATGTSTLAAATVTSPSIGDNSTRSPTTAFLQSFIAAQGLFKNLSGAYVSNTTATFSVDAIVLWNASGQPFLSTTYSQTLNTATAGAGGLDTGSTSASTWYYIWSIYNSSAPTTSILMSLSSTAPTMPSGYTYKARIGSLFLDGSKNIRGFQQLGRTTQWKVGSNLSALIQVVAGNSGSTSTPTWTAAVVNTAIPPTASKITVVLTQVSSSGQAMAAPNNSYGAFNSTSNPPPMVLATSAGIAMCSTATFVCEQTTFFYYAAASTTSASLAVSGYEDNL